MNFSMVYIDMIEVKVFDVIDEHFPRIFKTALVISIMQTFSEIFIVLFSHVQKFGKIL